MTPTWKCVGYLGEGSQLVEIDWIGNADLNTALLRESPVEAEAE